MTRWTTRSWIALGCIVVAFPVAMVVGEGLLTLLAEDPESPGLWVIVVAGGSGTLILAAPLLLSLILGRRGVSEGEVSAKAPTIVSAVLLLLLLAQTLLGAVAALI